MVPFEHHAVILYREAETAIDIVNVFYRGRDYRAIMTNKPYITSHPACGLSPQTL